MSDEYLWDRKGDPDPDVERLERALAPLRYREKSFELERSPTNVTPIRPRVRLRAAGIAAIAIAAAAAIAIAARPAPRAPIASRLPPAPKIAPFAPRPAFPVERIVGAAEVGSRAIDASGELGVGEWLTTGEDARARIEVADIGTVEVAGGSRVRLAATGPNQHRLELDRGSISAKIDAPPRLFVVGTRAATAVDLGCAYTLDVDPEGRGLLHVTSGFVSLEGEGRTSVLESGEKCETRPGKGPGTPWYSDAPAALRRALSRFDFEDGDAAIDAVFAALRDRDAITVWHMIPRTRGPLRQKTISKLRAMVPLPAGVRDADAMALDEGALDRWREAIRGARNEITW